MSKIQSREGKFKAFQVEAEKKSIKIEERLVSPSDIEKFILSFLKTENTIVIIKVEIEGGESRISSRVLQGSTTGAASLTAVSSPNDNVINIKPDAVFGLGLSLFLFFVLYNGFMCLYDVKVPRSFPSKPFKFGREL